MNNIICGDCIEELKKLPDESINMCMTSPPYWALRDYGIEGQLGLETTFEEYINKLCNIFDEVKRVLRDDGTCWVNLGDTYASTPSGLTNKKAEEWNKKGDGLFNRLHRRNTNDMTSKTTWKPTKYKGLKEKSLVMIPFRFAIEMVNCGWILRNTIIWYKRNCMPSSVKDRFTVDFEYLFFFVKNKKYYFETQYEPHQQVSINRYSSPILMSAMRKTKIPKEDAENMSSPRARYHRQTYGNPEMRPNPQGRNKRTVWSINPRPFSEAHFAVYPEELCETPIKAGCPEFVCKKCGNPKIKELIPTEEYSKFLGKGWHDHKSDAEMSMGQQTRGFSSRKGNVEGIKRYEDTKPTPTCSCNVEFTSGIVLDPFFGAGTTGLVALKQKKKFIGIELNKEYIEIAKKRLNPYLEQTKL